MLHRYHLGAPVKNPNSKDFCSIPNLLKNRAAATCGYLVKPAVEAAKPYHIPVRVGEYNSASGGGKEGVSNIWATQDANHTIRLVIPNKDLHYNATIHFTLLDHSAAQLFRVTAPSAASNDHIVFGNQTFNGQTNGKPKTLPNGSSITITPHNNQYTFDIPHISAALIVFKAE